MNLWLKDLTQSSEESPLHAMSLKPGFELRQGALLRLSNTTLVVPSTQCMIWISELCVHWAHMAGVQVRGECNPGVSLLCSNTILCSLFASSERPA